MLVTCFMAYGDVLVTCVMACCEVSWCVGDMCYGVLRTVWCVSDMCYRVLWCDGVCGVLATCCDVVDICEVIGRSRVCLCRALLWCVGTVRGGVLVCCSVLAMCVVVCCFLQCVVSVRAGVSVCVAMGVRL